MKASSLFLVLLLLTATLLTAQETKKAIKATAGATLVRFNDLTIEDLLYNKSLQKDQTKPYRPIDQRLYQLGYHFPASTKAIDEGNLRKFYFTDILTSDDPMAIKAFVDNLKNENLKDLVDIKINPADHQCELTVAQNIDSDILIKIFSALGFDGYLVYAQN